MAHGVFHHQSPPAQPNSETLICRNSLSYIESIIVQEEPHPIQKINQSRKDASLTLKTVIYKDMKDYIAMAVAWNRPHLAAWLDIYLDAFATDQRATDIIRTYGPTKEKP